MLLPGQSVPPSPRRFVGPAALGVLAVFLVGWLVFGRGPATSLARPSVAGGSEAAALTGGSLRAGAADFYGLPAAPASAADPANPSDSADTVAVASSPPGAPAHDPAKFAFGAKGMKGEVLAFMTLPELAYVRDTADLAAVSTLAFFGLQANAKGHIQRNSGLTAWRGSAMKAVMAKAHKAGTKVVASIVRFSWDASGLAVSKSLLSSATKRQTLASEVAAAVAAQDADGINMDFEPIPPGQKANYTDLVRRMRTALDGVRPGLQLTVAITGYFNSYDVAGLVAPGAADAIYLMGYHYSGWWSKYAGSTTPMGGARLNVASTVTKLRAAGVKPNRLIVGIPYYAHLWPTRTALPHARTLGSGRDLGIREALAILARYGRRWDPVEQSAWATWKQGGTNYQLWVSDGPSLAEQWGRFQQMGLLGTGMWSIGKEGSPGSINRALRGAWIAAP